MDNILFIFAAAILQVAVIIAAIQLSIVLYNESDVYQGFNITELCAKAGTGLPQTNMTGSGGVNVVTFSPTMPISLPVNATN